MEIIIAIIFIALVAGIFFSRKPKQIETQEEVPYKLEEPARQPANSPGLDPVAVALDLEPLTDLEPAKKVRKPRTVKSVDTKAVKKATVKTPVTKKSPAKITAEKKPRAPRKPKVE